MSQQKKLSPDQKRIHLREELWPGSEDLIWSIHKKHIVGFTTISRLMPLVLHLIKILASESEKGKTGDPSPVYLDLWCRNFGQGIVTITDEEECAYSSGYASKRAVRTWKEHIFKLEELGFIKTKPQGNRDYAHILLLDPLQVCRNKKNDVPPEWWTAFSKRAADIGALIPDETSLSTVEEEGQEASGWRPPSPSLPRRQTVLVNSEDTPY